MGILPAAIIPCIGLVVVCKRLSMIGNALPHTSLVGAAAGLLLGLNPVLTAATACVATTIGIEAIRRKIPRFSEMSIAITMSAKTGLAGVLSGFIKNAANLNSFLLGSTVIVNNGELYLVIVVGMAVLLMFLSMYRELFCVSLDEQSARLAGVPAETVDFLLTVLIAVTVSIVVRAVGALIVSSMMVVPVACTVQLGTNYRQTLILVVVLDVLFMTTGSLATYYLGLKPGGTVALVGVLASTLVSVGKRTLG